MCPKLDLLYTAATVHTKEKNYIYKISCISCELSAIQWCPNKLQQEDSEVKVCISLWYPSSVLFTRSLVKIFLIYTDIVILATIDENPESQFTLITDIDTMDHNW